MTVSVTALLVILRLMQPPGLLTPVRLVGFQDDLSTY